MKGGDGIRLFTHPAPLPVKGWSSAEFSKNVDSVERRTITYNIFRVHMFDFRTGDRNSVRMTWIDARVVSGMSNASCRKAIFEDVFETEGRRAKKRRIQRAVFIAERQGDSGETYLSQGRRKSLRRKTDWYSIRVSLQEHESDVVAQAIVACLLDYIFG